MAIGSSSRFGHDDDDDTTLVKERDGKIESKVTEKVTMTAKVIVVLLRYLCSGVESMLVIPVKGFQQQPKNIISRQEKKGTISLV